MSAQPTISTEDWLADIASWYRLRRVRINTDAGLTDADKGRQLAELVDRRDRFITDQIAMDAGIDTQSALDPDVWSGIDDIVQGLP